MSTNPVGPQTPDGALFAYIVGRWLKLHYAAAVAYHQGEQHEYKALCKWEDQASEQLEIWVEVMLARGPEA